jgi:YYY domain-containing protein
MLSIISWYFIISLAGWISFPVGFKLLRGLKDRGYAFARPMGLLLWGYIFWLLTSLGILQNSIAGILAAGLIVTTFSVVLLCRGTWVEIKSWISSHWKNIIIVEALFLLAFIGWVFVRGANPQIQGTEKPMELAFINAIIRTKQFPPNDPWLSGYAISYYYFGYVLLAMLAKVSGVSGGVAFNLGAALWFALTAVAGYGVLYNLLQAWSEHHGKTINAAVWGLLGPFYILIVSNVEGFLEMLHARGLFWTQQNGTWQSGFWSWLNILELNSPPAFLNNWIPSRASGGWWWWRASRVVQDFNLVGQTFEIIDEFPFFSYLLGDMHPHVLAMPFGLLATGLALNLFLTDNWISQNGMGLFAWMFGKHSKGENASPERLLQWLKSPVFWTTALILGGLAFLNTWDFPIYVALFCAAFALTNYLRGGWRASLILDFIELGLVLGICGVVLYLPFYTGFASQAGGILPSLSFFTQGKFFWVMFASSLLPIIAWLAWIWFRSGKRNLFWKGMKFAGLLTLGLWLASYIWGWLLSNLQLWGNLILNVQPADSRLGQLANTMVAAGSQLMGLQGESSNAYLLISSFINRINSPGTWISLTLVIGLVWGGTMLIRSAIQQDDSTHPGFNPEAFTLLLVLLGCGLVLVPEFFYLRDQFGWRMNTIFKFYFEAWIVWGLAAAFGIIVLWNEILSKVARYCFRFTWLVLLAIGLAYPVFGVWSKTDGFNTSNWTLDGAVVYNSGNLYQPDVLAAVEWLKQAPDGIIAEAVGGSYTEFARIATLTGLPDVINWPGHEGQWRGGGKEMGNRMADIELLYQTKDWTEAEKILQQYHVRYVYLGALEKSTYHIQVPKFEEHLKAAFSSGTETIYEVPDFLYNSSPAQP